MQSNQAKHRPQSEISESIQKKLESLSNSEIIKTLGELASDASGNERDRFSALLLLGSFEDKSAVAALLENISLPDYSLPKKPGTGAHPFTQDEYIRLGIVTRSERLIISADDTPSVWALKKIGVFALPQIFEYVKTASVGNCQRSAKAIYLICGSQKEYNHFVKEYFTSLPEQAQRALASLGYSEYD